jgi:hypothetical protein
VLKTQSIAAKGGPSATWTGAPVARVNGRGGADRWARTFYNTAFYLFKYFQTFLNLNWSKDGLLVLKSFEIKYTLK